MNRAFATSVCVLAAVVTTLSTVIAIRASQRASLLERMVADQHARLAATTTPLVSPGSELPVADAYPAPTPPGTTTTIETPAPGANAASNVRVVPADTPQVAGAEPVYVSPGLPGQELPQQPTPEEQERKRKEWLAEFDRRMDVEFDRLEAREATATDPLELQTIGMIKAKLEELDRLWVTRATLDAREQVANTTRAQQVMGEIITLARTDRNQRLTEMAHGLGISDPIQVEWFINQLDTILASTQLDWAALFSGAP